MEEMDAMRVAKPVELSAEDERRLRILSKRKRVARAKLHKDHSN
jgi:hypothetical protein